MRSSAWTAAAERGVFSALSARVLLIVLALIALAILPATAQTNVTPTTNTILFSGQNNTSPQGAIILYGSAISTFTGQPVRHLWVADSFLSPCRMDPELDAPGPWVINPA